MKMRLYALLLISTSIAYGQSSPPKHMLLCVNNGCNDLTWNGDYYDGTASGQTAIVARYWLREWTADHVEIYGRTTGLFNGLPAEGIFMGKISPEGKSLTNTQDIWHIGKAAKGTMPFTLIWSDTSSISFKNPDPIDTKAVCQSEAIHVAMVDMENKVAADPGGLLLEKLLCGETGVCVDRDDSTPIKAALIDSKPFHDGGGFTTGDPGSFLCMGLYIRTKLNTTLGDYDLADKLSPQEIDNVLQGATRFEENYKVVPLEPGHFRLELISQLVTNNYSAYFAYSGRPPDPPPKRGGSK